MTAYTTLSGQCMCQYLGLKFGGDLTLALGLFSVNGTSCNPIRSTKVRTMAIEATPFELQTTQLASMCTRRQNGLSEKHAPVGTAQA